MHSIVKKDQVRLADDGAGPQPGEVRAARERGRCTKDARLLEIDGRVLAIEVTCSCGERTVVELDYPEVNP
jgi:hypothetical protein